MTCKRERGTRKAAYTIEIELVSSQDARGVVVLRRETQSTITIFFVCQPEASQTTAQNMNERAPS